MGRDPWATIRRFGAVLRGIQKRRTSNVELPTSNGRTSQTRLEQEIALLFSFEARRSTLDVRRSFDRPRSIHQRIGQDVHVDINAICDFVAAATAAALAVLRVVEAVLRI